VDPDIRTRVVVGRRRHSVLDGADDETETRPQIDAAPKYKINPETLREQLTVPKLAQRFGNAQIFNTDHGQFTGAAFTGMLTGAGVAHLDGWTPAVDG